MLNKICIIIIIVTLQISFQSCTKTTIQNSSTKTSVLKSEGKIDLNKNIYDLSVKTMDGQEKKLSDYKGKALLIVNVASECGYTSQYEGLENLYRKYKDRGFEVLAFPSNDFGEQEPGTNDEIKAFCELKYNVTFPLFDKIKVLGDAKNPLYERLTNNFEPLGDIGWNFEKFLIDKNGNIAGRYKSKVKPESDEIVNAIESKL